MVFTALSAVKATFTALLAHTIRTRHGMVCGVVVVFAEIVVRPGQSEPFVTACRRGFDHVMAVPGCKSVRLTKDLTDPDRFHVIAEWESLDALHNGFYGSGAFTRWRNEVSEYFAELPLVEHTVDVD
ncbi:hypothetical protein GCM10010174_02640 [Kutzneria viridogrisea]